MSAWIDAWSVRHWAYYGSTKIWECCETCSTKVLHSSFGVWNWMGFFGHSTFCIKVELIRQNSDELWVRQDMSEHLIRKSSFFAKAGSSIMPVQHPFSLGTGGGWQSRVFTSAGVMERLLVKKMLLYMNSTRLVMRLEPVRITSFLETGWLAQPSAHTSATIRKPFLHASYFQH